jgi:hypothetical protein
VNPTSSSGERTLSALVPSRRAFVLSAISLAALAAVVPSVAQQALAQRTADGDFMRVSRAVVDGALDATTGQALHAALKKADATFDARLQQLAAFIAGQPPMPVEALAQQLDVQHQTALRGTLNQVVSAWYLGTVGTHVIAYAGALMYRPTADVLSPPSYVHGGPLNWVAFTFLADHG